MNSVSERNRPLSGEHARHDTAWAILPWFVNGSLSETEHAEVAEHIQGCLTCTREVRALRQLARSYSTGRGDPRCENALEMLHRRLDQGAATPRRLPWAAVAVLLVAAGLTASLTNQVTSTGRFDLANGFTTLGARAVHDRFSSMRSARVVFKADVDSRELVGLLDAVDATIADGPSLLGAYTVKFPLTIGPQEQRDAIESLRGSGRVVMAEPIAVTLNERNRP